MTIHELLKPLEVYKPIDTLTQAVELLRTLCGEDPVEILPSVQMGQDGPLLTSLVVVTASYVGEVRTDADASEIDFVAKGVLVNYRVKLWTSVTTNDVGEKSPPASICEISLVHAFGLGQTSLSYVGDDREDWLQRVLTAIPVSTLLLN